MSDKKRAAVSAALNLACFLLIALAILSYFLPNALPVGIRGVGCFNFFTTDSNVLAAIACLITAIFSLRFARDPEKKIPEWVRVLKWAGTTAVTLTLLVVVFFLGPTSAMKSGLAGYLSMFKGEVFILHFSAPVLSILSFLLFDPFEKPKRASLLFAMLPTVLYSVVYLVMVVFAKKWADFYGFTFGGKTIAIPLSLLTMYLVTFLIAALLRKGKKDVC